MTREIRQNLIFVSLWILITILLAALIQTALQKRFRAPENIVDIVSVRLSENEQTEGEAVSLPLRKQYNNEEAGSRSIVRLSFSLQSLPDDGLFMFISRYQENVLIDLNGSLIFQSTDFGHWKGPLSNNSAYLRLPTNHLRVGENELKLTLSYETFRLLALSDVVIAPRDTLYPYYASFVFMQTTLKPVMLGAQIFLALLSLVAFILRTKDALYAWLSGLLFYACGVSAGLFADFWPYAAQLSVWFIVMAPIGGIFMTGFSLSFAEIQRPGFLKYTLVIIPLPIFALVFSGTASFREVAFAFSIPLTLILYCLSAAIILFAVVRKPTFEGIVFLCGLCLLTFGVLRDFANGYGENASGFMLSQFSRTLAFIGVAVFIVRRQAKIAKALDLAADTLRKRLAQKEEELREQYAREERLLKEQAVSEERRRLTADLHDGVAGHLATIVALADLEASDKPNEQDEVIGDMRSSARNALIDLRLVLDALSVPEPDLRLALASFRDRCVEPIERMGVSVEWSMAALPDTHGLTRSDVLHIVRILQEALTNAVRHGAPACISIEARGFGPDSVEIHVENRGGIWKENPNRSAGLGVQNMRARAQALKGSLDILARPDGAILRLIFPVRKT